MPNQPLSINVYVWKANEEELALVERMVDFLIRESKTDITYKITDLHSYTPDSKDTAQIIVTFGSIASSQLPTNNKDLSIVLPEPATLLDTPENKQKRRVTVDTIKIVAKDIQRFIADREAPLATCVEMPDGTTVGEIGTDIKITTSEAEYLKMLKELLGGCKIILTKGNTKIEVN